MEDIKEQYEKAKEENERLEKMLLDAREEHMRKKVLEIEEEIPMYTKKLERLKKFIEEFKGRNVSYGFRKVNPYYDDYHEVMSDPLDWRICEYDLLGMHKNLEIVFDYSNEAVQMFVDEWMKKNVVCSAYNDPSVETGFFWKK